jgi:uncharacterized protein (TIGR02266 family)
MTQRAPRKTAHGRHFLDRGHGTWAATLLLRNQAEEKKKMPYPSTRVAKAPVQKQLERRRSPRVALETNVGLISESNFYTGFSQDISEGGLFVATYALRPVGTSVVVRFAVDEVEIEAPGRVRWQRDPRNSDVPPGMGIEFEGLDAVAEEAIRRFVTLREPLFHEEG